MAQLVVKVGKETISNYRQVPSTLSKCRRLVGQEDKAGTLNWVRHRRLQRRNSLGRHRACMYLHNRADLYVYV